MKQKFLTLALTYATVILFINACKNETSRQDDASENALLHNRVEVRSTVKYADSKGIEKMYLETLCDAVLLSKIQAKDFPFQTFVFDSLNSISIDEIKNNLGIIENKTKVVYGSRLEAIRKNLKNMYKLHYFGNLFY